MTTHAHGTFHVAMNPLELHDHGSDPSRGRMSLDKQFFGDLEATSTGEMLTAGTAIEGSAGYVAIERVAGTLHGRNGTFVLQHSGIMTRGMPQLYITVIPDSGTEKLTGIAGTLTINFAEGQHAYEFEYTLE